MVVVVFEFEFNEGCQQRYFDLVAELQSELDKQDGFISGERFESLGTPGRFVSVQAWRDEASVKAWRENAEHRLAQEEGKDRLFRSYRLRVAEVLRDYTDRDPAQRKATA